MAARVLWCVVIGFLLGVFARSFLLFGLVSMGFVVCLGIAMLAYGSLSVRSRLVLLCGVFFISCALGAARMHAAVRVGPPELVPLLGTRVAIEGSVVAEPDVRESSVRLSVRTESVLAGSTKLPIATGMLAVVPAHTDISYGDYVRLEGVLRAPESFDTGLGRSFAYPLYLAKDGILYELARAQMLETHPQSLTHTLLSPMTWALGVKSVYLRGLHAALPEPHASLAAGITVGDKRGVGKELSDVFRRVGLTHMLVLSGYNITVVIDVLRRSLALFPPFVHGAGAVAGVLFLVLVSGVQASAVRAAGMALVAVYARASGRVFLAARVLGVVCAGMVLWNPFVLAFDPGFQLSALATLGLIVGTPLLEPYLRFVSVRFGLREIVAATISAQTAVLPLLLYQNGVLPLYSLFANVLVLAFVPLAMGAALICALGGMVFGAWGVAAGLPAYGLLSYIIGMAGVWASAPYAAISLPPFGVWWLFGAYVCLGYAVWWEYAKKKVAGLPLGQFGHTHNAR